MTCTYHHRKRKKESVPRRPKLRQEMALHHLNSFILSTEKFVFTLLSHCIAGEYEWVRVKPATDQFLLGCYQVFSSCCWVLSRSWEEQGNLGWHVEKYIVHPKKVKQCMKVVRNLVIMAKPSSWNAEHAYMHHHFFHLIVLCLVWQLKMKCCWHRTSLSTYGWSKHCI